MQIKTYLIWFIIDSFLLRIGAFNKNLNKNLNVEKILGKEKYLILSNFYSKTFNTDTDLNLNNEEYETLMFLYYDSDFENKSIQDIENEYIIKNLLE